jgi:CheY-like chemotaxis protein
MIAALKGGTYNVLMLPIDTREGPGSLLVERARAFAPGIDALVLLRPQDRDRLPALIGQEGNPALTQRLFDGYLVRPVRASSLQARLEALMSGAQKRTRVRAQAVAGDSLRPEALPESAARFEGVVETVDDEPDPIEPRWTARLNVLVAEDNDINALLTRTLLERDGHTVRIAKNGNEVLAVLNAEGGNAYDLVLMDLHMPNMDGFEATRHVRALADERSSLPIIALTANAMADDRQTCLIAGMDDYLSKPVSPDALARMLATWSGRRSDLGISPADAQRANLA